ncbi:MAG: hypothetical protein M1321_01990 [Candidatus Marsarchaeota archaeon]|nr:hypothetical protein [Candidatus Marsarchaeota archaeon]
MATKTETRRAEGAEAALKRIQSGDIEFARHLAQTTRDRDVQLAIVRAGDPAAVAMLASGIMDVRAQVEIPDKAEFISAFKILASSPHICPGAQRNIMDARNIGEEPKTALKQNPHYTENELAAILRKIDEGDNILIWQERAHVKAVHGPNPLPAGAVVKSRRSAI